MLRMSLLIIALLLNISVAHAETRYITDSFYVPLRVGPSDNHRIIHRGLKSGTPVELLDTDETQQFSHVQIQDGRSGWLPARLLQDTPIAADQLPSLLSQLKLSQQKLAESQTQLAQKATVIKDNQRLSNEVQALSLQLDKFKQQHQDTLDTAQQLAQLQAQHAESQQRLWRWLGINSLVCLIIGLAAGLWLSRPGTPGHAHKW